MAEPEYPFTASTIGAGFVLNEDGAVGVMIALGDADEAETVIAGIVLSADVAKMIRDKLTALIEDVEMAEKAVATMGLEPAREYLNNWSKRANAPLN